MYQNNKNENDQSNETEIIDFEVYYNDDYEHEIHFNEFVWYAFNIENDQFFASNQIEYVDANFVNTSWFNYLCKFYKQIFYFKNKLHRHLHANHVNDNKIIISKIVNYSSITMKQAFIKINF